MPEFQLRFTALALACFLLPACSGTFMENGTRQSSRMIRDASAVTLEGVVRNQYGLTTGEFPDFPGLTLEEWHWIEGHTMTPGTVRLEGAVPESARDKLVRLFGRITDEIINKDSRWTTVQVDSVQILN